MFARDDYTCQLCGQRGGRLAAHHILPFAAHPDWRLAVGNGVSLCWPCHYSIRHKEAQYVERFLLHTGWRPADRDAALAILASEGVADGR